MHDGPYTLTNGIIVKRILDSIPSSRWKLLSAFAIPLAFIPLYLTPLWDIDFWWHLATGRSMVELGLIPDFDSLGVYSQYDLRASNILHGYWLTQLIFYLVFANAGTDGIIWLRAFFLISAMGLAVHRSAKTGADWRLLVFYAVCLATAMESFAADRPATASYLLFSSFIALLAFDSKQITLRRAFGVGVLVVLWANMHGSVALGALILLTLAAVHFALLLSGPRSDLTEPIRPPLVPPLLLIGLAALSLLSPNHIDLYRAILAFEGSEVQMRTSEYMSPWSVTSQLKIPMAGYWTLVIASPFAIWGLITRRQFSAVLILALLLAMSLSAYRYVPYFLIGAGPMIVLGLHAAQSRTPGLLQGRILWLLASVGFVVALITVPKFGQARFGINDQRFPIQASAFVQNHINDQKQFVFNHYNWGGYLIYQFSGAHRIFIDGRNLEMDRFAAYTHILWATPAGRQLLHDFGFSLVMIPEYAMSGERYALVDYLAQHPGWALLYRDNTAHVFQRAAP